MARPKKKTSTPKVKQLVRIRLKTLANGERSIYLDLYKSGKRAYEFLKDDDGKPLRLLVEVGTPDEVKAIKERNHKTVLQAESLRVAREKEVVELGKVESKVISLSKMLLKDWMQNYMQLAETSTTDSKQRRASAVMFHLKEWLGTKYNTIQMNQIDTDFCREFLKHLHSYSREGKGVNSDKVYRMSHNNCFYVFLGFRSCLDKAVKEGVISKNPTDPMKDDGELPRQQQVQKAFLTADEVKALMQTECSNLLIKQAFLFSCFCGLRISDIIKLEWKDIRKDGQDLRLQVTMQKTRQPLYMKLNSQAIAWMPKRNGAGLTDKVFVGLPTNASIGRTLRAWSKKAGITKDFTFHAGRHTFATLSLNSGTDIYTVSKLMGHTSLETTQIYAELLNQSKDRAVDRLSDIFKGVEGV